MVWMYQCAGDFSSCDGSGAGWFKIDQMGMTAPPLTGTSWGTAVVEATLRWTSKIPSKLAPGNYLIRHELLALHQANAPQWYPECAQLVVTGTGKQTPAAKFMASIPAYASATDPGVDVSNIFQHVCDHLYSSSPDQHLRRHGHNIHPTRACRVDRKWSVGQN